MHLHPIGETLWHQFPGGGITGLALLQEIAHRLPHVPGAPLIVLECILLPAASGLGF